MTYNQAKLLSLKDHDFSMSITNISRDLNKHVTIRSENMNNISSETEINKNDQMRIL